MPGKNIKALRQKLGLTQRQLAELTGMNQTDICKIETGQRDPSLKQLELMAEALGKKAWQVLKEAGK